jgi:hypothetical protein
MGLFKKRTAATEQQPDPDTLEDALRDHATPPKAGLASGLFKFLPIGELIKGITGIIRDPNGKISSKRAGAGALVVAGIDLLYQGQMPAAIVCLVTAVALFALTKWDTETK